MKMHVSDKKSISICRSVYMFLLRISNIKHQSSAFKMSPFLEIDYSFARKALRAGQRNYEEKYAGGTVNYILNTC